MWKNLKLLRKTVGKTVGGCEINLSKEKRNLYLNCKTNWITLLFGSNICVK